MFLVGEALRKDKIVHGFFGRRGGAGSGIYESLNCGVGSEDNADHVAQNRAIVAQKMGVMPEDLLSLYQIHSDKCVTVTEPWMMEDRPQADAMVTDKPGIGLGILTADCGPVLFYGEKPDGAPVIGAAHAGWGGAVKGILESTLAVMKERGANPETLCAAVGPCIQQVSYEVSNGFEAPFMEQDEASGQFFKPGKPGHLQFDLPGYIVRRLMLAGVAEISDLAVDTCFNEMDYFSYRRATKHGEPDYGRQISVIAIKSDK